METKFEPLQNARDYREFLRIYLEKRDLSLSDLARATGFGRGFPGDVISGRRRLTIKSQKAFEKALKLPAAGKKFFRYLVARDEPDLYPEIERARVIQAIEELRVKPWERPRRDLCVGETPGIEEILKNPAALSVFAAAGQPGNGASLEDIEKRTRLGTREIDKAIQDLRNVGLLRCLEGRFEPSDLHLFLKTADKSRLFTAIFQETCRLASERSDQAMSSEQELFFASAFCVDERKMKELKAALRSTILKFVDDSINAEGNRVVRLSAALHF